MKRRTSKDVVASLDQRVAGVETSMAGLKTQVEGLEGLDSDFTSMKEDIRVALNTLNGDLKLEIHDLRDAFMEATINGVNVHALVDYDATHNFVAGDEAKQLGIDATKGSGTIKAVNSLSKAIHGLAKDVWAKIREWEGTIDFLVVPMDDFKVVLGLEFLDR
nr:DNA damage-inducible protein 1-like [Tanacetum cinerariifolium]